MHRIILTLLVLFSTIFVYGQNAAEKKKQSGPFPKDWVLVEKGGLYGFISSEGKEIIKPQYTRVSAFDEVQRGWAQVEKDGFIGFISIDGKEIIKPKYTKIHPFGELQRGWALVEVNGLYGFVSNEEIGRASCRERV